MTEVIALFSNKGGVGKTTLAYHLAHMVSRLGVTTLAVDLDPQAYLTSAFFDDAWLEDVEASGQPSTIGDAINPLIRGTGDIVLPPCQEVADGLWVLPGDLGLLNFEDSLSDAWPRGDEASEAALRTTTAFHRIIQGSAAATSAAVVFVDFAPNLGSINRAALLGADHLVIPLAPDLFSLRGLENIGPTLRRWRDAWQEIAVAAVGTAIGDPPRGDMQPMGYVVLQSGVSLRKPANGPFAQRIPGEFARSVLGRSDVDHVSTATDPYCLASLRHYRSLMPLAQDARKPMFDLRAADGALGSTARLVAICFDEFQALANTVLERAGISRADDE